MCPLQQGAEKTQVSSPPCPAVDLLPPAAAVSGLGPSPDRSQRSRLPADDVGRLGGPGEAGRPPVHWGSAELPAVTVFIDENSGVLT